MCGAPSPPEPPPPPPPPPAPPKPPKKADEESKNIRDDERAKAKSLAGAKGTIKTSPLGDQNQVTTMKKKLG